MLSCVIALNHKNQVDERESKDLGLCLGAVAKPARQFSHAMQIFRC